jgi:hypothetical protein
MNLFKRKTSDTTVGRIIVDFVKSHMPSGVTSSEMLTNKDTSGINVISKPIGVSFELDFDDLHVHELSEVDKKHLINTVIIPALKKIDQDLFVVHREIEAKIKELKE